MLLREPTVAKWDLLLTEVRTKFGAHGTDVLLGKLHNRIGDPRMLRIIRGSSVDPVDAVPLVDWMAVQRERVAHALHGGGMDWRKVERLWFFTSS